jgi:hypothetical protein
MAANARSRALALERRLLQLRARGDSGACAWTSESSVPLPPPPSRTNLTRLVPSSRTNWTRLVPRGGGGGPCLDQRVERAALGVRLVLVAARPSADSAQSLESACPCLESTFRGESTFGAGGRAPVDAADARHHDHRRGLAPGARGPRAAQRCAQRPQRPRPKTTETAPRYSRGNGRGGAGTRRPALRPR